MLLQVLGSLEGLATELALVRLQGNVNTDVGSDVVALDGSGATRVPLASEAQVVCAFATNMSLTDVFLQKARVSNHGSWVTGPTLTTLTCRLSSRFHLHARHLHRASRRC